MATAAMASAVCAELGFDDVVCVHARAEEPPEGFRESFDCAVSRAVARLNLLCELCLPYVRPGGLFICSGIVSSRSEEVRRALENASWKILEQKQKGDWTAFVSERRT